MKITTLAMATAVGALALLAAATAHATPITGELTVANANLATQGSGPYAEYTITELTTTSFEVQATGLNSFVFGDGGSFALNLSAAAGTGTLCTTSCTVSPSPITLANGGSRNEDGFGSFNFSVNEGNGFSSPSSSLTFEFTTSNAVDISALLDTTIPDVAGHLALSTNTACTGFAANGGTGGGSVDNSSCTSPTNTVPEPTSLIIFGSALAGFGFLARRRRKAEG